MDKLYWDLYYKNTTAAGNSDFATHVYTQYIKPHNDNKVLLKIADMGCGNCRDSRFLAEKGNYLYAIDSSLTTNITDHNIRLIHNDVLDAIRGNRLETLLDLVYMRWFLHAMPHAKAEETFDEAVKTLKPGGLIAVEVRSIHDTELLAISMHNSNDNSYTTDHTRWLYDVEAFRRLAHNNDLNILELSESRGWSKTTTEDPLLIRFVAQKPVKEYFRQSTNYTIYSEILPGMKKRTMASYNDLDRLVAIFETIPIKYTAVYGTLLGLNRHGGIIPWDNDIDIGFISSEWEKLMCNIELIENKGLPIRWFNKKQCRFGLIDCFLLDESNSEFYNGVCGVPCSKAEYATLTKQIFGPTYIYAPVDASNSLSKRYGKKYFVEGDVNDNYHYKNPKVGRFRLNHLDYSYQIDEPEKTP